MPEQESPQLSSLELFAAFGILAVVLHLLFRRKALPGEKLKEAPDRFVDLGLGDLAAVFLMIYIGQYLYLIIDQTLDGPKYHKVAGSNDGFRRGLWHLLSQLLTQGLPVCYVLMRLSDDKRLIKFGFGSYDGEKESGFALWGLVLSFLLVFPVNMICLQLALFMGGEAPAIGHDLLKEMQKGTSALPLQMASAILLAPIFEEIIFRGILQTSILNSFQRNTDSLTEQPVRAHWMAIIIAAALFSVVHYPAVPVYVLPGLFTLGILLGWLYERTSCLWPSIFIHAAFNAINTGIVLNPQFLEVME